MIKDLSDEGLVRVFGDAMHEMPELYEAIRRFELKSRPAVTSSGFKMKADWVSMQSVQRSSGGVLRLLIGNLRSKE